MNRDEIALLREIKSKYVPILEDVQDFAFAVIEPQLTDKSEYETILHIYGEEQGTLYGSAGKQLHDETGVEIADPRYGKKQECPMCGGKETISLSDAIKHRTIEIKNNIEGVPEALCQCEIKKRHEIHPELCANCGKLLKFDNLRDMAAQATGKKKQNIEKTIQTLEGDISYLNDALKRYQESGKSNEMIQCPNCSGWEWIDFHEPPKGIKKRLTPWNVFVDWLLKTLEDAGLSPMKISGFKSVEDSKQSYGISTQWPEAEFDKYTEKQKYKEAKKKPVAPQKHLVIAIEPLGRTKAKVQRKLSEIFNAAKPPDAFKIEPFPSVEISKKFESTIANTMKRSTSKIDDEQLRQIDDAQRFIENNRCFYVTAKMKESRFGEELGLPPYEITTPLNMSVLLKKVKQPELEAEASRFRAEAKESFDSGDIKDAIESLDAIKTLGFDSEQVQDMIDVITKEKRWPDEAPPFEVDFPVSVGEIPPRIGEWGKYTASIKEPAVQSRKKRSEKAHEKVVQTKEEIRGLILNGIDKESIMAILLNKYKENMVSMGRTITDEMLKQYNETIIKDYEEVSKEETEREAGVEAAKYPGSKYKHWDDKIDWLADELGSSAVAVEFAVSKYMDSLDIFPKPFDFDRLSTNDAVRALNKLDALEPKDIDNLVMKTEGYLNDFSQHSLLLVEEVAALIKPDLGSMRANAAYTVLRTMNEDTLRLWRQRPLFMEDREFSAIYASASKTFDMLLRYAAPQTKIAGAVPIVEDSSIFSPDKIAFWDNVIDGRRTGNSITQTNAAKLAGFYKNKIGAKLFESLSNLYHRGGSPAELTAMLDTEVCKRGHI